MRLETLIRGSLLKASMTLDPGQDPVHLFTAETWRDWLAANHAREPRVWILIGKKDRPTTALSIEEALDVALCFGWIDGRRDAQDVDHFKQCYSPRRKGSPWSLRNVENVQRLDAAGLMAPAGLVERRLAEADGRWAAAYPGQADYSIPEEMVKALESHDEAGPLFDALTRSQRYALVLPVLKAVTPARRHALAGAALRRLLEF